MTKEGKEISGESMASGVRRGMEILVEVSSEVGRSRSDRSESELEFGSDDEIDEKLLLFR